MTTIVSYDNINLFAAELVISIFCSFETGNANEISSSKCKKKIILLDNSLI